MVDGSTHAWLPLLAGQKQDLILVMDDTTSEVYTAYLVPQEGTLTVMKGLKEVIIKHGVFCSLYTDRGSHFFYTPKEGGAVNRSEQAFQCREDTPIRPLPQSVSFWQPYRARAAYPAEPGPAGG